MSRTVECKVYGKDGRYFGELTIRMPTECILCRAEIGEDAVMLPESQVFDLGDPLRIVGWCAACCPEEVRKKWEAVTTPSP